MVELFPAQVEAFYHAAIQENRGDHPISKFFSRFEQNEQDRPLHFGESDRARLECSGIVLGS